MCYGLGSPRQRQHDIGGPCCLQRHGISRLPDTEGDKPTRKRFKPYPIGYFHIDIVEVQTAEGKLHLFVAIDRTSKLAFAQVAKEATRVTASAFLNALVAAVPYRIHTVLTDNGRSCPRAWCRSDAPGRAGPLLQVGTADSLTGAVSLTASMVSSIR